MKGALKLREIERLRAVAALLVVCVHWWPLHDVLPKVLGDPWSGVDLFFVISGYVVSLSLMRLLPGLDEQPSFVDAFAAARSGMRTFYVRRLFRILPAALAVAILVRALCGVFPAEFGTPSAWLTELVMFLGGIYNYAFTGGLHLNVYWSLSVEEHFYLLLPVLFLVFRTPDRRVAACTAVAAFSVLSRAAISLSLKPGEESAATFFDSHCRFDSLMAGVVLALVSSRLPPAAPTMPRGLVRWAILPAALALLACLPGAASKAVMTQAGFVALWMLGGLLVAYASLDRGYVLQIPVLGRALEVVGARSYSLYLLHQQVFRVERGVRDAWPRYASFAPESSPWTRVLVLTVATCVAVELLYRLVEQPMIRLGRRVVGAG